MYVVHVSETPRTDASRYSFLDMNILEVEIKLEYV